MFPPGSQSLRKIRVHEFSGVFMIDSTISLQLDLLRLDATTRKKVIAILEKLQKDLTAQLSEGDATEWGKRRLNQLLSDANETITRYYADAQIELSLTTEGLPEITAKATRNALVQSGLTSTSVSLPSDVLLGKIASDALIQGSPLKSWWKKQEADFVFKFSSEVRQGIVANETNQQIIRRVTEAMDISKKNAAALVQTATATVANDARMAVYKANADVVKGVRHLATLDKHVCLECAPRDGMTWTLDGKPINATLPFKFVPLHPQCRCTISPLTKYSDMGKGERASSSGPVDRKTTFEDYLLRQPKEWQDDVLGKGRSQLWREKKLTLTQLINGDGSPLTLDELRIKYK